MTESKEKVVMIIGGGAVGAATALEVGRQAGLRAVVLERNGAASALVIRYQALFAVEFNKRVVILNCLNYYANGHGTPT